MIQPRASRKLVPSGRFVLVGPRGAGVGLLASWLRLAPRVSVRSLPSREELGRDSLLQLDPRSVAEIYAYAADGGVERSGMSLRYDDLPLIDLRDPDVRRWTGTIVHVTRNPLAAAHAAKVPADDVGTYARHVAATAQWLRGFAALTVDCAEMRRDPRGTYVGVCGALGIPATAMRCDVPGPAPGPGDARRAATYPPDDIPSDIREFGRPGTSPVPIAVLVRADDPSCLAELGGRTVLERVSQAAVAAAGSLLARAVLATVPEFAGSAIRDLYDEVLPADAPDPAGDRALVSVQAAFPYLPAARLVALGEALWGHSGARLGRLDPAGGPTGCPIGGAWSRRAHGPAPSSPTTAQWAILGCTQIELLDVREPDGLRLARAAADCGY